MSLRLKPPAENPRYPHGYTRSPNVPVQPLLHLSNSSIISKRKKSAINQKSIIILSNYNNLLSRAHKSKEQICDAKLKFMKWFYNSIEN
jgi:hypothetical protein